MTPVEARRNALLAVLCLFILLLGVWLRLGLLAAAMVLVGAMQGAFIAVAQSWWVGEERS